MGKPDYMKYDGRNVEPPFTHEGTIRGADARTPKGYQFRSALRQTKRYWVTTHGVQFRKEDGFTPGNWGMYRLDLDSVTPCTHNAELHSSECSKAERR